MKLFLWQQFSSNHSSHFTVVGMFITPEQAEQAATTIRHILGTIAAWSSEHSLYYAEDAIPPTEQAFIEQYQLVSHVDEWSRLYAEDAFGDAPADDERLVAVREQLVLVTTWETWLAPTAHYHLMQRLGAVSCAVEWTEALTVSLWVTALAPDEAVAAQITAEVSAYIAAEMAAADDPGKDAAVPCPWNVIGEILGTGLSTVMQDGRRLRFDLQFYDVAEGLGPIDRYLRDKGCTDVEYAIRANNPAEVL